MKTIQSGESIFPFDTEEMINDILKELDPEKDNFLTIVRTHGLVKRESMILAEKFDALKVEQGK